jgi:hypothetical protein
VRFRFGVGTLIVAIAIFALDLKLCMMLDEPPGEGWNWRAWGLAAAHLLGVVPIAVVLWKRRARLLKEREAQGVWARRLLFLRGPRPEDHP